MENTRNAITRSVKENGRLDVAPSDGQTTGVEFCVSHVNAFYGTFGFISLFRYGSDIAQVTIWIGNPQIGIPIVKAIVAKKYRVTSGSAAATALPFVVLWKSVYQMATGMDLSSMLRHKFSTSCEQGDHS